MFHRLIQATQAQSGNNFLLLSRTSDGTSYLCNFELGHCFMRSNRLTDLAVLPKRRLSSLENSIEGYLTALSYFHGIFQIPKGIHSSSHLVVWVART